MVSVSRQREDNIIYFIIMWLETHPYQERPIEHELQIMICV